MSARLLSVVLALLLLAACGGGGSAPSPGAVPSSAQAPSAAGAPSGMLPGATGTIGAGYVECDTAANIAAGNHCNGYANFSNGAFAFTAVAATASGAPIVQQLANGGALGFSNGAYRVVESPDDGAAMISISGGPWAAPGSALSGAGGAYGNRFFVTCLQRGTAHLQLQLVSGSVGVALPFATASFPRNESAVDCSSSQSLTVI